MRQCAAGLVLLAAAGCSWLGGESRSPVAESRPQSFERDRFSRPGTTAPPIVEDLLAGFFGAVAGDEPRSVLVAREILLRGGSAADAAVAMYFALSATKPSAAGIGAAGACMIYDPRQNRARALDFAAPAGPPEPGAVAPPLAPRAMFALHAAFGRLRWAQVVAPAESIARFGAPVSRSFARDLAAAEPELMNDPEARRIFGRRAEGGGNVVQGVVPEGYEVTQFELAGLLASIRQGGPGVLHSGPLARSLLDAVAAAGGRLGEEELRDAVPSLGEPVVLPLGVHRIGFVPGYDTLGPYQAQFWSLLTKGDRLEDAPVAERLHMIADASARARAAYTNMLPEGRSRLATAAEIAAETDRRLAGYSRTAATAPIPPPRLRRSDDSGTSFTVMDKDGQAVGCGFTLYRPFGLGRMAPGLGFFPAQRPGPDLDSPALSPLLVWNENTRNLFFAGAGAGLGAASALVATVMQAVVGKFELDVSVAIPRLHHLGVPDALLVEQEVGQDGRAELTGRGHLLEEAERFGPLNAIYCADGMPRRPDTCASRTDWRGVGLAVLPAK